MSTTSKPLGQLLKDQKIIGEEHICFAVHEQKITGEKLGEILVRLGFVTEYDIAVAVADQAGVPYLDVEGLLPPEEVLSLFNKSLCLKHIFLPIGTNKGLIHVASPEVSNPELNQLITRHCSLKPTFYLSEKTKTVNAINKLYYFAENPIESLIEKEVKLLSQDVEGARDLDKLVRYIMELAVKMRATDIHIRPIERSTNISFRIDGVLTSVLSLPPELLRVVSLIKTKAEMDIAEQRLPQDGGFSTEILNGTYDVRVSTIVSPQGENLVLRLLPKENSVVGLHQLGFLEDDIETVKRMFNEPYGIVLITGPTGSGKSTTLYAGVRTLNLLKKNVVTVEDPIEYKIPLLRQTQVNEKAGYTFAGAIRHFLRHDPDVILVGEVRDSDTAATAVSASATGHLVLSTLHTNDAVGAIPRLRDLGVNPFMLADSLVGVMSQRLVRKICTNCKGPYNPSPREKVYLGDPSIQVLYKGKGCNVCQGTGYFGRTLVYEILVVNHNLARLISQKADPGLIAQRARKEGFADIFSVAALKAKQGVTTTEEIKRNLGQIRQAQPEAGHDMKPISQVRAV
ncbi:MAG: Flp pilus assembly complex ATPase component TadA [Deltaproteobacteria bacterium]|nr:Flp pilus assembly complex ATPase component TadA [Deltaproteobacteria bacterium]